MAGNDGEDHDYNPLGGLGTAVGRLLAALGLLSLFDEAEVLKLRGQIEKLITTFSDISAALMRKLFGWIEFRWISVSEIEGHVLFLIIILGGAIMRSSASVMKKREPEKSYFGCLAAAFVAFVFVILLPALAAASLVPGIGGAIGALLWLAIIAYWSCFQNEKDNHNVPASKRVRNDLVWVLAMVTAVVFANFFLSVDATV